MVSDDGQSRKKKRGKKTPGEDTPMSPPGAKSSQNDAEEGFGDLGKSLFKSADDSELPDGDVLVKEAGWKRTTTKLINAATKVGSYMANIQFFVYDDNNLDDFEDELAKASGKTKKIKYGKLFKKWAKIAVMFGALFYIVA